MFDSGLEFVFRLGVDNERQRIIALLNETHHELDETSNQCYACDIIALIEEENE